ncbi:hypothetical protein Poli38472_006791 [Pythium oligandrum]|uniref:Uncharacterized protein n=1 Tax=Pythium oligandrum TaxID=41045 RepID=A0A8K1C577_PYTOL|nr:hypothetical protein Poli38472_006791 [Pythium oligandrum]|eukprot:TMW56781.1 hypothetical protein Poli38472_006791 [Pythium oligandrum]
MLSRRLVGLVLGVFASSMLMARGVVAGEALEIDTCPFAASVHDLKAGINAIKDVKCLTSRTRVGCFSQTCRFCQMFETEQSKYYLPCGETEAQQADNPGQYETSSQDCASAVSPGDQNAGISAFYDSACPGLTGCQANKCRFCKRWSSPQSSMFPNCPTTIDCSTAVAQSKLSAVSSVIEPLCVNNSPRLTGCVKKTQCRLCRSTKNAKNQYLVSCKVLKNIQAITATSRRRLVAADNETEKIDSSEEKKAEKDSDHTFVPFGIAAGAVVAIAMAMMVIVLLKEHRRREFSPETPRDEEAVAHTHHATPIVAHL